MELSDKSNLWIGRVNNISNVISVALRYRALNVTEVQIGNITQMLSDNNNNEDNHDNNDNNDIQDSNDINYNNNNDNENENEKLETINNNNKKYIKGWKLLYSDLS